MQRAPQAVGRVYFFRNSVYFFLFIRSPLLFQTPISSSRTNIQRHCYYFGGEAEEGI